MHVRMAQYSHDEPVLGLRCDLIEETAWKINRFFFSATDEPQQVQRLVSLAYLKEAVQIKIYFLEGKFQLVHTIRVPLSSSEL